MERETLNAEDIETLIQGGTLPPFVKKPEVKKRKKVKKEEVASGNEQSEDTVETPPSPPTTEPDPSQA